MTPAPETGRTAEDLKADIIAALNAAFRGFSFPGGRWSEGYGAQMAAEALLAGPLAPVLAEIAQLRSRLLEAEKDLRFKTAVVDTLSTGIGDARRLTNGWAKGTLLLLPFVDMAAGEGLEWVEQEDRSPRMDAADLCAAFAKVMGCELGDADYTALLAEGRNAIRALNPNQEAGDHEPC